MISTKILEGIVVSDKADKTIVVTVSSRSKTKFKGKTVKRSERYLVHDPLNDAKEGDVVIFPNNMGVTISGVKITGKGKVKKGVFLNEERMFGICKKSNDSPKSDTWSSFAN